MMMFVCLEIVKGGKMTTQLFVSENEEAGHAVLAMGPLPGPYDTFAEATAAANALAEGTAS